MENYVHLAVLSDSLDPEEISSQLGLSCDEAWVVGDKRVNTLLLEKENGWVLKSRVEKNADLEDHIESVMELIKDSEHKFKAISCTKGCIVQLSYISYCESTPALNFENEVIDWLSSLGASLDIDIYRAVGKEG